MRVSAWQAKCRELTRKSFAPTKTVEQIDPAVRDLRARGVSVSDVRTVSNGRLASLKDPDGNELVLWSYA